MTLSTSPASECWLHPEVAPRPSPIAGTGLFATQPLRRGTVVERLGGQLVNATQLTRLVARAEDHLDSVVVAADLRLVLPEGTPNHYGNHSCDPTIGWTDAFTLVTLEDLSPGQELTSDYATSTCDPEYLLRCHCGSPRCRQMIEGTDWQIPQLQRRYAGHWTPYLQELITDRRKLLLSE